MAFQSKYLLAATIVGVALGSGYIMQNGDVLAAKFAQTKNGPPLITAHSIQHASAMMPVAVRGDAITVQRLPSPPAAALAPLPRMPNARAAIRGVGRDRAAPVILPRDQQRSAFGLACDVGLTARNADAAMVTLSVTAPCALNERVEIEHAGLIFAVRTSNTGNLELAIPALATEAAFTATFRDGTSTRTAVSVPQIRDYDRVAMTWSGPAELGIHALEYGARYGEEGHVWADAPRNAEVALHARGGFLTRLGEADLEQPMLAEIYSFPSGTARREGVVRLNVEAEVTAYTCGRDISARTAQLRRGETVQWLDLTLAVPACDTIGGFLVLKNLLQDLKIAQN